VIRLGSWLDKTFDWPLVDNDTMLDHAVEVLESRAREGGMPYSKLSTTVLANYFYYEKKDIRKAVYWAHKGAEMGCNVCYMVLCYAYAAGIGVISDGAESAKWCYLALANNDEAAKKVMRIFEQEQEFAKTLSEGKRRAREWMGTHPQACDPYVN